LFNIFPTASITDFLDLRLAENPISAISALTA